MRENANEIKRHSQYKTEPTMHGWSHLIKPLYSGLKRGLKMGLRGLRDLREKAKKIEATISFSHSHDYLYLGHLIYFSFFFEKL